MEIIHEMNEKTSEREKREKYNPDEMFKNKTEVVENTVVENKQMIFY